MENLENGKRRYRFAPVKRVAKANNSPRPDFDFGLSDTDFGLSGYPAEKRSYRFAPVKPVAKANNSPRPDFDFGLSDTDFGLSGYPAEKRSYRFAPVKPVAKANNSHRPDFGLRGYPAEMYSRRFNAFNLRICRNAGGCIGEKKICISARGARIDQWHEDLYGFPRVVVHGIDSICAVARTKDVEDVNHQATKAKRYVTSMSDALIYEAEDLALPLDEVADKMTSRSFKKPFIAVSVVPGTTGGHEASGDEYDVDRAIKFLKEQMASGKTFNFEKTVKTAILTLEHLFGTKFEAQEIRVFYARNHSGRVVGGKGCSDQAYEFPARAERCIKDYLTVLNKPHSRADEFQTRAEWNIMDHLAALNKPHSRGSSYRVRRLVVINKPPGSGGSTSRKRGLDVIKAVKRRLRRSREVTK